MTPRRLVQVERTIRSNLPLSNQRSAKSQVPLFRPRRRLGLTLGQRRRLLPHLQNRIQMPLFLKSNDRNRNLQAPTIASMRKRNQCPKLSRPLRMARFCSLSCLLRPVKVLSSLKPDTLLHHHRGLKRTTMIKSMSLPLSLLKKVSFAFHLLRLSVNSVFRRS